MAEKNEFAIEFLELLRRSKFPQSLELEQALQEFHAIVAGLTIPMLALMGATLGQNIAAQGVKPGGSGGPHRMDLILRFIQDANQETLRNTQELLAAGR